MAEALEAVFVAHKIDSSRPTPYHIQVYQSLEKIIHAELHPGDQLPGEPKLCKLFGVSRTVIRQALDQLLRDGLVVRIMGKGTFVAEPKIHERLIGHLTGFFEDMAEQGYTPVSHVLKQERAAASAKVARNLKLEVGDEVIELKRLRFVNDAPIQITTTYLPYALCPSVLHTDFSQQSLYAHLHDVCNLHIARGTRLIEAVLATKEESELLNISLHAPLILIDSVSYLEDGTPVEYYHAVHRSDRVQFEVNLVRMDE